MKDSLITKLNVYLEKQDDNTKKCRKRKPTNYTTPLTKICKTCNIEKPANEFHFDNDRIHLKPDCKLCGNKKQVIRNKNNGYEYYKRPENILKRRLHQNNEVQLAKRKKYWQENFKGKYYNDYKEWAKKYPEKIHARSAILKIKVEKGYNKHHWSYNKEHYTDIIILSTSKHMLVHKHMIYDQREMMFRDIDGRLLNTKELHLEYINSLL